MLPEERQKFLEKIRKIPTEQLKEDLAAETSYGPPSYQEHRLVKNEVERRELEENKKIAKESLEITRKNADSTANLVKATWGLVCATAFLVIITFYSFYAYKPKIVVDSLNTKLVFNLGLNFAEFQLRFVLQNKSPGSGDISKPTLIITAKDVDLNYELSPVTSRIYNSKREGNTTTFYQEDLGRVIHVGGYGRIDEFIKYNVYQDNKDKEKEIFNFLKTNRDKLQFKIRGEPFKEILVSHTEGRVY